MSIQWFPGHMNKARNLIEQELRLTDVVLELIDARIPYSGRNPLLDQILGKRRPRLLVFHKADLADPECTQRAIEAYQKQPQTLAIATALRARRDLRQDTLAAIRELSAAKRESYEKRGAKNPDIRVMVVGVPNVGKSSFINALIGKESATTGSTPGVTRGKQWLRLTDDIELLDTPGLLWPKVEDEEVGYRLALTGAVADHVFVQEEAAFRLVSRLKDAYPASLALRYDIEREDIEHMDSYSLMLAIGRRRGALVRGNQVDDEKTSRLILKDFRDGKLGQVSLECDETVLSDD